MRQTKTLNILPAPELHALAADHVMSGRFINTSGLVQMLRRAVINEDAAEIALDWIESRTAKP